MDTKQKYYNYSRGNSDTARRNKDNQDTSFDIDEHNKWHVQYRNGKRIISLLGLFELSTRNGLRVEGLSELAAAELAVHHINKRERLLPGYTLQLITNDTKVFFSAIYILLQDKTTINVMHVIFTSLHMSHRVTGVCVCECDMNK